MRDASASTGRRGSESYSKMGGIAPFKRVIPMRKSSTMAGSQVVGERGDAWRRSPE